MKKIFLVIVTLMFAINFQAQTMDDELTSLVNMVKMLRDGSSISYSKVKDYLKKEAYGSFCVMRHKRDPDVYRLYRRFKTLSSQIEHCKVSIGQIA